MSDILTPWLIPLPPSVLSAARRRASTEFRKLELLHGQEAAREIVTKAISRLSPPLGHEAADLAPVVALAEILKGDCKPGERADLTGCTPAGDPAAPAGKPAAPAGPAPKPKPAKESPARKRGPVSAFVEDLDGLAGDDSIEPEEAQAKADAALGAASEGVQAVLDSQKGYWRDHMAGDYGGRDRMEELAPDSLSEFDDHMDALAGEFHDAMDEAHEALGALLEAQADEDGGGEEEAQAAFDGALGRVRELQKALPGKINARARETQQAVRAEAHEAWQKQADDELEGVDGADVEDQEDERQDANDRLRAAGVPYRVIPAADDDEDYLVVPEDEAGPAEAEMAAEDLNGGADDDPDAVNARLKDQGYPYRVVQGADGKWGYEETEDEDDADGLTAAAESGPAEKSLASAKSFVLKEPCTPGHTAERDGCAPEDGGGASPLKPAKPDKKPAAKPNNSGGHPGAAHGSTVTVKKVKGPAFKGDPVATKTTLTKQETGRVGEAVALAYLKTVMGRKDARPMNSKATNFPVDMLENHAPTEVKAGLISNSRKAQQWRLTFSKESAAEIELYDKMSPDERKAWNAEKQKRIHERKGKVIAELEKKTGRKVKPRTLTLIINPDTRTADVYVMAGLHDRIDWRSDLAKKGYAGTVAYG